MERKAKNEIPHAKGHSCGDYVVKVGDELECSRCGKKLAASYGRRR